MATIIDHLMGSGDPAVRLSLTLNVLGESPASPEVRALREEVRESPRVRALLSERQADGRIPGHPYSKWGGAHWVLVMLADLGYPPGDDELVPLRDQTYDWLLGPAHEKNIRTVAGRVRRCASQEGNALYASLRLGLADERTGELARRLREWQWPDGGWNCDRRPEAATSSFHESLIPLRGLALHAQVTRDEESGAAAERAAELFLKRRLFRRLRDGRVMNHRFVRLCYPSYWHYDVLSGLKVMAEAGRISDDRCGEALDLLESKRLPGGGFPADAKHYSAGPAAKSGRSLVEWGGAGATRANEFVSAEALSVLKAAGR